MVSTPSPPPVPDPYKTASAQTGSNVSTAIANSQLQNANVNSYLGSSNFSRTGNTQTITDNDGKSYTIPQYQQDITLSPSQQKLFDQQNAIGSGSNDLALSQVNRLQDVLGKPLDASNVSPLSRGVYPAFLNTSGAQLGPLQNTAGYSGNITDSIANAGPIQTGVDLNNKLQLNQNAPTQFGQTAQNIQYGVGPSDFSKDRTNVENALYSRIQPQLDRDRAALSSTLATQGIVPGSKAYNDAIDSENRQANDARYGAITAGGAEQSRLFGMALNSGQFNNSAQQQDYGQQQGRGLFGQAGILQNNNAALGQTAANNAATLNMGNFANSAQQQQYGQNASDAKFSNDAQAQRYGQNANNVSIFNNAAKMTQDGQLANLNFVNGAQQQVYNNNLSNAKFGNEASQQQLAQDVALRNQPLNEISALMHGGQVTAPQFAGYNSGSVDGTPVGQYVYNSAGIQNQQYQTQANAAAQTNAGLFSLGGSLAGGLLRSDRRLKRDIIKVGTDPRGFNLYLFKYKDDNDDVFHHGVMADEVENIIPGAVMTGADGFKMVDYNRIGLAA